MRNYNVVIIGAGASGIAGAISAKRAGNSVVICERLPALGKKILASGGGRCNLLNEKLNESFYNPEARALVKSVFARFGKHELLDFFNGLGLYLYSEEGRFFPVTNQAASVVRALELELDRLSIPVVFGFEVVKVATGNKGFCVFSKNGETLTGDTLILAGGGKSYPALGSNGSCYAFARQFGHTLIEPVPSCVPVEVSSRICHILQGQKINVNAKSVINGKICSQTHGELLFTRYGLSGPAILDISQELSLALNRDRQQNVSVRVDLVPFLDTPALEQEITRRLKKGFPGGELLTGIVPGKCHLAFAEVLQSRESNKICASLKNCLFRVQATRGWNEAEFTCGGIAASQIKEDTLESKIHKGLFFCGEVLDVEGKRGGYNLAWAFGSGFVAGLHQHEARRVSCAHPRAGLINQGG